MVIVQTPIQQKTRLLDIKNAEKKESEDKENEKKNKDFIQVYRTDMPELRWLMINHAFSASVLFYILEKMDGKNVLACSFKVLEEYFDKSNSTLQRAVRILRDKGFLTIAKMGTSNVYIVNTEVAWTSYDSQKDKSNNMYAEFDGKILISQKENQDYSNNQINIKTVNQLKNQTKKEDNK